MQDPMFFDLDGWDNYLGKNLQANALKVSSKGDSEKIHAIELIGPLDSSFKYSKSKLIEKHLFTSGLYMAKTGPKVWGYFEQLSLNVRDLVDFKQKQPIPSGIYRVRVEAEPGKNLVIRTFTRHWGRWKQGELPIGIKLDQMLKNGALSS